MPRKRSSSTVRTGTRSGAQLEIPLESHASEKAPRKRKELTTFSIVMVLVFATVLIVTYISNVVAVDQLVTDITHLEKREAELKLRGENIRASMNVLSSYLRIKEIAIRQLQLVHSGQQPLTLHMYNRTNER